MTIELLPGEFIDVFVNGWPKNYVYTFVNTTDTTKAPKNYVKSGV